MPPAGSKNAPEARAREKIDRLLEDAGLRSALEQIESVLGDLQARAALVNRD